MKKTYDLRINSHGRVDPMKTGLFEKSHEMVYGSDVPFPHDQYITIELPLCIYRLRKDDMNRKIFADFIEKARKHQKG
jgi:hypothetical protein